MIQKTSINIQAQKDNAFLKKETIILKKRFNGQGSIYTEKRNNRTYYIAKFTAGFKDDGKIIRKTIGSYDKEEVVQKLNQALYQVQTNDYILDDETRFGESFLNWIYTYKRIEVASSTFTKYETAYRLRIKPYPINDMKIKDLKSINFQQHINRLYSEGESIKSLKWMITITKSYYKYLIQEGITNKNPLEAVKLPYESKNKKENTLNVFTRDEQKILLENLTEDIIDQMIQLDLLTGLRLGEITGLKWTDYDGETLKIQRQYKIYYKYDQDRTRKRVKEFTDLKTEASYRTLPLPEEAKKIIRKVKSKQAEARLLLGPNYHNNDLIFADYKGDPIDHKRPLRRLERLCRGLKLTKVSFHGLRHTYATRLFEEGVKPKVVQHLLGHSTIETTMKIYVHVLPENLKDTVKILDAMVL